eukprot:5373801-Lingulodinium_polyedra.AAC.1
MVLVSLAVPAAINATFPPHVRKCARAPVHLPCPTSLPSVSFSTSRTYSCCKIACPWQGHAARSPHAATG